MAFHKPYRVKSNSQMKGSDKKKLKARISSVYGVSLTEEHINLLLPQKEEITCSKIYTFTGESMLLYVCLKNAIFFEHEKDKTLLPSVYTLWKHPQLLPVLTTFTPVMSRLANGADLMLPGIIVDKNKGIKAYHDGKLKKGDLVAVNLQNNLAPIAVGKTHLSSEDMYMAANRGKGVEILHFYGDQLWASGSRVEVPDLGPPLLPFLSKEDMEDEDDLSGEDEPSANEDPLQDGAQHQDQHGDKDDKLDAVIQATEKINLEDKKVPGSGSNRSKKNNLSDEGSDGPTKSPQEMMDEHLHNAFNQSWKTTAKKIELPILTSNFFRLHMVKNCPPDISLDVKKSSFKKLSKFLEGKEKFGVIKIKELQKGVESIVAVDYEHEDIKHHRVVKYQKEETESGETVLPCDKEYEPPTITELHTVSGPVHKLFSACGIPKGAGMTSIEVRQIITKYVKKEDLQIPSNKSKVKLDPVLADVVLGKGENSVVEMKWDELIQRIISKMSSGFSLQFPGQPPHVFKGKLEPVELCTATRSGNKKITLIYNLETYRIDPQEFAHKCQVGVAASTAVNQAVNRKAGSEVMIQGNQISFAVKLLTEEYRIPKKYIKGVENAPKKKK